jgi:CD63 antigen
MVSGGMTFIKYLLFVFNLIIFLAGLILVGVGIAIQTAFKKYFLFFGEQANSAAIFLIIIGFIVLVVSFFGCCGAYKENHCMIVTFAVLLGAVFILEVSAAIAAFVLRYEVETIVRLHVASSFAEYNNDPSVKNVWEELQQHLECCGADNFTDWETNPVYSNSSSVPDACCVKQTKNCGKGVFDTKNFDNIFSGGCTAALLELGRNKIYILGGVALGLAFLQIFGVIIACCLAAAVRKEYTPMQ